MSTPDFKLKRNDTLPIKLKLFFSDLSLEEDLDTAASITFFMWKADENYAPLLSGAVKANGNPTVDDLALAIVVYKWDGLSNETDTEGKYAAEVEVVRADGVKVTFPGDETYVKILITPDLGDAP
jgi:hypothetical protein